MRKKKTVKQNRIGTPKSNNNLSVSSHVKIPNVGFKNPPIGSVTLN